MTTKRYCEIIDDIDNMLIFGLDGVDVVAQRDAKEAHYAEQLVCKAHDDSYRIVTELYVESLKNRDKKNVYMLYGRWVVETTLGIKPLYDYS